MLSFNHLWVILCSALVMLMTPGLAFFYGGLARRKNVAAIMTRCVTVMGLVGIVWVLWGYSIAFGPSIGGLFGNLDFIGLRGVLPGGGPGDTNSQTFMIFQGMFAIITVALVAGAFAVRMRFISFVLFVLLWVTIVYAPLAHWVWNSDGWLYALGSLDFAGGTVVHISSGVAALATAVILGPRLGFGKEEMRPHNTPFVLLGAGILWFGWFGFNAGSALGVNTDAINAFVVTNIAASAALVTWIVTARIFGEKPNLVGASSGAVAGLVAITPASGFVGPMPAIIIGFGAGVFCYLAINLINKLNIDDAMAVFGVHGVGGTWGAIATGLFVGIGYAALDDGTSRILQVWYQIVGVLAAWGWSLVATTLILFFLKYLPGIGLREESKLEEVGADLSSQGQQAYLD